MINLNLNFNFFEYMRLLRDYWERKPENIDKKKKDLINEWNTLSIYELMSLEYEFRKNQEGI